MNTDHFVKVFDVLDSGFRDWPFPAFGLIFVAIGLIIFFFPRLIKGAGIPYLDVRSTFQVFFRYGFLGFAILWTAAVFFGTYSQYLRHRALAQENRCSVVEGPVRDFVPMPYTGHARESFSVSGVTFRYSDFVITGGFNNTSSHGGPIKSDSYVRICYDPSGNVILRLEIRDFAGELKDYSSTRSFSPSVNDIRNASRKPPAFPWYGNLFIVLYLLDFVGILTLFVPYLRTFFRLKTAVARDCLIPRSFEPGMKMKLRNSLIYWDRNTNAIWLRPRGFNLVQIPLTVARLNVGADGTSITGDEVRFSSGFPLVMALVLWTAYALFSSTWPANVSWPSPGLFVGIATLVFAVAGFVNLRILRLRMEKLMQDAYSELRTT